MEPPDHDSISAQPSRQPQSAEIGTPERPATRPNESEGLSSVSGWPLSSMNSGLVSDPLGLAVSDNKGLNLWIGFGAIYVNRGQQT
jgi:hypothetical protein